MKAVVTIFQFRRAVLPYLFMRHCYPVMKKAFSGAFDVWIIQDKGLAKGNIHTSAKVYSDAKRHLITEWTDAGRYAGATIVRHDEPLDTRYPQLLPSYRIGMEIALRERADFHLWLEDDAIVLDRECGQWGKLLAGRDAGVYQFVQNICPAFFVSTPAFDTRLLPIVRDRNVDGVHRPFAKTRGWRPSVGEIEYYTTWACKTERALLSPASVARVHSRPESHQLVQFVTNIAPNEVGLLNIDFPWITTKSKLYGMARRLVGAGHASPCRKEHSHVHADKSQVPRIFVVGHNKTGTRSLHEFFLANQIPSIHWDNGQLAMRMHDNFRHGRPLLDGYERFVAFSDMEAVNWGFRKKSRTLLYGYRDYFPHLDLQYPGALFLFNTRSMADWIDSRLTHWKGSYAESCRKNHAEISGNEHYSLDDLRAQWNADFHSHQQAIRSHFGGSDRFLEFDITLPEAGETLARFLERHGFSITNRVLPKVGGRGT